MRESVKIGLIAALASVALALFLFFGNVVRIADLSVTFRNGAYARVEPDKDNIVLNSRMVAVFMNNGSVPTNVEGVELILGDGTDPKKDACEDRLWTFDLYSPPFSVSPGEVLVKTIDSFDEVLSRRNEGIAYGELANGTLPRNFVVCARLRIEGPSRNPSYSTVALSSTRVIDRRTISSTPLLSHRPLLLLHKIALFGAW